MKNKQEKYFHFIAIISLKGFSEYNKKHGWKKGDRLLAEVASLLSEHFPAAYIFRVFGDDFVLMSKKNPKEENIKDTLSHTLKKHKLKYEVDIIDLELENIFVLSDIEAFQERKK